MLSFDARISTKLDGWADGYPGRQALAILLAKYLVWAFLGAAMVAYQLINHTQEGFGLYLLMLFVVVGVPHLFSTLLSFLIRRKRPYERSPDAWHLPIRVYTPSFPSGHATIAFATLSFLLLYWQPTLFVVLGCVLVAALIAVARVLVGVHYVSDIFAGALIGGFGGWLVLNLFEKFLLLLWI